MNQNPCPICEQLHADVVCPRNKTMTTEQWVPALDVYKSEEETREALKRGGIFSFTGDRWVFSASLLREYNYLLGSDPYEPKNKNTEHSEHFNRLLKSVKQADEMLRVIDAAKHTKEQPMQPEPDRMAHLIDCARQVLDGKTLQFERPVDGSWYSVTPQSVSGALSYIVAAMDGVGAAVRIKPEPVVLPPLYFMLRSNNTVSAVYTTRSLSDTHKLTITNDDGKLSAVIEELKP